MRNLVSLWLVWQSGWEFLNLTQLTLSQDSLECNSHESITLFSPSILEPNTHSFSCFAPPNSCCCAVSWLNEQHAEDRTLWSPIHARQMGCDTHAVRAEEFCGAQLKCVIMCNWLDVQKVWSIILRRSAASSGADNTKHQLQSFNQRCIIRKVEWAHNKPCQLGSWI